MALSLDDRILGEKTHYYCSSSEDEGGADSDSEQKCVRQEPQAPQPPVDKFDGCSKNTGPKGVVHDWRRFKQLEAEDRQANTDELRALTKKLAITCRTNDEEAAARAEDELWEETLGEMDDAFFRQYREMRMQEVQFALAHRKLFGQVLELTQQDFVEAVDKENEGVKVVVHIYEQHVPACRAINLCYPHLATRYPTVKFCRILSKQALVSRRFTEIGLPAFVVYKKGEVINSLVNVSKDLGEDIELSDLEDFLTEYGILSDELLAEGQVLTKTASIRDANTISQDSDSE